MGHEYSIVPVAYLVECRRSEFCGPTGSGEEVLDMVDCGVDVVGGDRLKRYLEVEEFRG